MEVSEHQVFIILLPDTYTAFSYAFYLTGKPTSTGISVEFLVALHVFYQQVNLNVQVSLLLLSATGKPSCVGKPYVIST